MVVWRCRCCRRFGPACGVWMLSTFAHPWICRDCARDVLHADPRYLLGSGERAFLLGEEP